METTTRHSCNPRQPGKPLPFGKHAPVGECPRCDELAAGAEPRTGWGSSRAQQDAARTLDIRAHFAGQRHLSGGCGPVCTYGDW